MSITWINLILLVWNLICAGYLVGTLMYRWACYVHVASYILGGYYRVLMVAYVYLSQRLSQMVMTYSITSPSWSLNSDLREISFTYKGTKCSLLFEVARNHNRASTICTHDGLDVTTEVQPYMAVSPVRFTQDLYGEELTTK